MNHIQTRSVVEAMKQALEALDDLMGWQTLAPAQTQRGAHQAITALRTVIEEAESRSDVEEQEPAGHFLDFTYAGSVGQVHAYDQFTKGQPFYTTPLATPVQEQIPVGYWHKGTGAFFKGNYLTPAQEQMREAGVLKPLVFLPAAPVREPCQYAIDVAMPEYRCVGKCQYAAQRQRVGLTPEEIDTVYRNLPPPVQHWQLARAIEAKLKEKNSCSN
jgi:hypothetical protein